MIAPLAGADPRYAALAAALALVVAAFSVIGWSPVLGFLADLLSKPALVGCVAGVAC
jgi:MFS superfamily sulfate permease-like transporter